MYGCATCGGSIEIGKAYRVELKWGTMLLCVYLCTECFRKYQDNQLNVESVAATSLAQIKNVTVNTLGASVSL